MNTLEKKKLIRQYKEADRPAGIYLITNKVTGKRLLGSSMNVYGTLNRFKMELRNNSRSGRVAALLLPDYQKHGAESFQFELLDQLEDLNVTESSLEDDLKELLSMWQDKLPGCNYKN